MQAVIALLRTALPILNLAAFALRLVDSNNTGVDDKAADAITKAIESINAVIAGDTSTSGVVSGLNGITTFGNNVLSALDELLVSTAPKDERVAHGTELVASLSDPTKVYQAQRGKDADALQNFKIKAEQKLIALKAV